MNEWMPIMNILLPLKSSPLYLPNTKTDKEWTFLSFLGNEYFAKFCEQNLFRDSIDVAFLVRFESAAS